MCWVNSWRTKACWVKEIKATDFPHSSAQHKLRRRSVPACCLTRLPPWPTGLMNHMFSCLHMLTHPAWPDSAQTHQSRCCIGLSHRRNSQWEGGRAENNTRATRVEETGEKDGGSTGRKWRKRGQMWHKGEWERRLGGERIRRDRSADGEKMERKIRQTGCECLSRYGSSVTQHR